MKRPKIVYDLGSASYPAGEITTLPRLADLLVDWRGDVPPHILSPRRLWSL